MKILVATSAPAFWKPQAECLAQAMRRQGHKANVLTPTDIGHTTLSCDTLLCIGSGESLLPFLQAVEARARILFLIESLPTPTEQDAFTRSKLNVHRDYIKQFGFVFVHSRRSIAALTGLGVERVEALVWPHFPTIFAPSPNTAKDIEVLFVGTMSPYRKMILSQIAQHFPLAVQSSVFHCDAASLFGRAKVVLNIHATGLRNFECRVIEALGCGAFLLTERLDPDDLLFDEEHLAVFHRENLLDLVDRYLRDSEKRERIARAGNAAIRKYGVDFQVERILEEAARLLRDPGSSQSRHRPSRDLIQTRWHPESRTVPARQIATAPSLADTSPANLASTSIKIDDKEFTVVYPATHSIDYMLREILERKVYPFFPFLRRSTDAILDIGANIGCTAILFRTYYPDAPIIAFEPGSETFACLRTNTAVLSQVQLHPFGLFDRDGIAKLFKRTDTSTTDSFGQSRHNTSECEQASFRRLSSFLAEHQIERIGLLKMDTEGAEVPLLRDIETFLDRIDVIMLEYHSERDRLEIDHLLSRHFILANARADLPHRGTLSYVAKRIATQTNLNRLEIARPLL